MKAHKDINPESITPEMALQFLQEGNSRFVNNLSKNRDHLEIVDRTKDTQKPFAAILSCMDSRTSAELIFDQGLGDIFSIRIAGNISNNDIVGSLEYATKAAGSKLILVLGHTNCGAVKGACDNVEMGNLTGLLAKIRVSVDQENTVTDDRSSHNADFVQKVCNANVKNTIKDILHSSPIIRELVESGQVGIASAIYDVGTGIVTFNEDALIFHKEKEAVA